MEAWIKFTWQKATLSTISHWLSSSSGESSEKPEFCRNFLCANFKGKTMTASFSRLLIFLMEPYCVWTRCHLLAYWWYQLESLLKRFCFWKFLFPSSFTFRFRMSPKMWTKKAFEIKLRCETQIDLCFLLLRLMSYQR